MIYIKYKNYKFLNRLQDGSTKLQLPTAKQVGRELRTNRNTTKS